MRLRVTILFIWLNSSLLGAWADTIHLRNGRTIVADHVRENGNHYEYELGDDSYAIPKSLVEHVDAGGMPVHAASAASKVADLPTFTPADGLANEGDLVARILRCLPVWWVKVTPS
jgi:hypothetical protein